MPTWVTHTIIADKILDSGLPFDETAFVIGNVGPDCNVENKDYTFFIPPRETTHFMMDKNDKTTIKADEFIKGYVQSGKSMSRERLSFFAGYYTHLFSDKFFTEFVHTEKNIHTTFERLRSDEEMAKKVEGLPETNASLRSTFGSHRMNRNLVCLERDYLQKSPNSRFNTILRKTVSFPDYLDFLPEGAITRKLAVINNEYDFSRVPATPEMLFFFGREEFSEYLELASKGAREGLLSYAKEFQI